MKADPTLSHADQCRQLGINVGDSIIGHEGNATAVLTLLWVGDTVAVWRARIRHGRGMPWHTIESANWTLGYREWRVCEEDAE